MQVFEVPAKTGQGIEVWLQFLTSGIAEAERVLTG